MELAMKIRVILPIATALQLLITTAGLTRQTRTVRQALIIQIAIHIPSRLLKNRLTKKVHTEATNCQMAVRHLMLVLGKAFIAEKLL